MPRVKVPDRIRELAAELGLDLADQSEITNDPAELDAWMRHENGELACEESQHREDIDTELADLETEMMEQINDHD